jgi:hypothetical protein
LLVDPNTFKKRVSVLAIPDRGEIPDRIKWETEMVILFIKGTIATCEEKENLLEEAFLDISGSATRLHITKSLATDSQKGVLFVGKNLDKQRLVSLLLSAKSNYGTKKMLRTRESFTAAELAKIKSTLTTPEGYQFDGRVYYNPEGELVQEHPFLERMIVEFLEDENERVGDFNRKVQKD